MSYLLNLNFVYGVLCEMLKFQIKLPIFYFVAFAEVFMSSSWYVYVKCLFNLKICIGKKNFSNVINIFTEVQM
jgi:hypothetical protein